MYKVVGVDEAGKGPVLGSMFVGFSIINLQNGLSDLNDYQEMLTKKGVKDSKKLTPLKRNKLYQELKELMDLRYVQLTPAVIDSNHFKGGNLFDLQVQGIAKMLNELEPNLVIIDALTSKPETFGDTLKKHLTFECKIISENKADVNHSIVGAASICAKELREQELEEIRKNIGHDCGSGYPADPKTKEFLKEHWNSKEFDFIFRKSWATYKNLVGANSDRSLLDF